MSRSLVGLTLVAFLTSGCVPVTEPLGDISKAEPDKKLVGTWTVTKSTGVSAQLAYTKLTLDAPAVKGNPKGLMRAVKNDETDSESWFFTTALGKHTYATVLVTAGAGNDGPSLGREGEYAKWAKADRKRYFVFRYALDGDNLTLDAANFDTFKEVAKAANLDDDGAKHLAYYTTPDEWLAKYLAKSGSDKIYDGSNALAMKRAK